MSEETDRKEIEYFEMYYALGDERSLRKTAKLVGVSQTTIAKFSKKYNWPAKVAERDALNTRNITKYDETEKLKKKISYRRTIKKLVVDWIDKYERGEIKIKDVNDLMKLINMDLELSTDELSKVLLAEVQKSAEAFNNIAIDIIKKYVPVQNKEGAFLEYSKSVKQFLINKSVELKSTISKRKGSI